MNPEEFIAGLDPDQKEAATTLTGPVRIMAGAGTGKTRAITHRIAYGIQTGVYKENDTLAVTFTAKAAAEMRSRLRDLSVPNAQARTFHSAALAQLRYFWPHTIGGPMHEVLKYKSKTLAGAAKESGLDVDRAVLRDIASHIEWAKVSMYTPENYLKAIRTGQGDHLPEVIDPATISYVYAAYEDLKIRYKAIDFEDVLLLTVGLLEDDPRSAAEVRQRYKNFVVDEYQDISPLQQRLLDLWLGQRDQLCVVGDANQTIYSFTGATARYLLDFPQKYPRSHNIELVRDYRSNPEIVASANTLLTSRTSAREQYESIKDRILPEKRQASKQQAEAADASWAPALHLVSQVPEHKKVQIHRYSSSAEEPSKVASSIAEAIETGTRPQDIAILIRINSQSQEYENALNDLNITYQMKGSEKFFVRKEVQEMMAQVRSAAANEYKSHAQTEAERGFVVADVDAQAWFYDLLENLGYVSERPVSEGASAQRWESLNALFEMVQHMDARRKEVGQKLTMTDIAVELENRAKNQHNPETAGVTIASLHSAKGLEWDTVYMPGLNEGTIPINHAKTPTDIDEERRLFYVGLTRAKRHLYLSWAQKKDEYSTAQKQPSRFVKDIEHIDSVDLLYTAAPRKSHSGFSQVTKKTTSRRQILCTVCGKELTGQSERKKKRCLTCKPDFDEELFEALKRWRKDKAEDLSIPPFIIFNDVTLEHIARDKPDAPEKFLQISGIQHYKSKKYSKDLIEIVKNYRSS